MHAVIAGIVIVVAVICVAGFILAYVAQLAGMALKALGLVGSSSKRELQAAARFMTTWTAQKIGRAARDGDEVEVFEPKFTSALPEDDGEVQRYRDDLLKRSEIPEAPEIVVPRFPDLPDVLQVPDAVFRLGRFSPNSEGALESDDIPTLLAGRSERCSIPAVLDKQETPAELQVQPWTPVNGFPDAPRPPKAVARRRISLRLPLYAVKPDASMLRVWFVEKLNAIVRGVHHQQLYDFEEAKAKAQAEFEQAALDSLRFKAKLSAWEAAKASQEAAQATALAAHETRVTQAQATYRKRRGQYNADCSAASDRLATFWQQVRDREPQAVCTVFNIALSRIVTPRAFPREWKLEYDRDHGILILDLRLPDFERVQIMKQVALKRETKIKPVSTKEQKQLAEVASCLYLLRSIHEVVAHDEMNVVRALTVNGWVEYVDATTGRDRSIVIVSIFAEKEQLEGIDISRVEPVKCISALGGRFAGIQHGYVAIAPIVRLNRHDDRLIEGSDVLSELATGTNLAAMPWDKFEHLIRQLFERVFAGPGIEVKVTRASRDRGVDAIIFDPDPIRGGKTVIQAKRYINTVDLSAVRDLYGTVVNEGANKGILVTTSSFGPDAYEFSKDKNLTLLSGRELLGLLEKHGYQYRIDLDEARKLQASPSGQVNLKAS